MKFLLRLVDVLVVVGLFGGVAILMEQMDRYAQKSVSAAKREAKRQADLSPDEYIALMKSKAEKAGIKVRKHK